MSLVEQEKIKTLELQNEKNQLKILQLQSEIDQIKRKNVLAIDEEDKMMQIIDLVAANIYWKDPNGKMLGCNKYVLDMFGLKDRKDMIGKNEYDFLSKDEADEINKIDKLVLEKGSYDGEEPMTIANGKKIVCFTSKRKIVDNHGNIFIACTSLDITDKKKIIELEKQQIIFNEEAKIMQIIDLVNASIYWKSVNGEFLGCNKYMLDVFGVKERKDVIGKNEYDLLPKDEADVINQNDKLVLEQGSYNGEEHATINGEQRIYFTSKRRIADNNGNTFIVGTSLDITAQKKITELEKQHAILNEEAKIMQIINLVDASIYWKDKDGHYLGCNKYVLDMAGLTHHEEIIGKTDNDLFWKNDASKLRETDELVMKNGRYHGEEYITVANSDKRENYFLSTKNQLLDENNNIIGVIGTSLDITAQKEAAQAVAKEQERFRTAVEKMLHDINSPISSLTTIAADASSNMPENARVTLRGATERIGDITRNLMSRYENKDVGNEKKELLVSSALLQVMQEKRYEYHNRTIKFETIVAKESANFAFTKTVPGEFKRMLSNLINNAVEAIGNKADGKIELELATTLDNVIVSIEDNGSGMPKHIQDKFRNGISVTEGKDGRHSGVGLMHARETILASGGTFDVYATDKVRTRIVMRFPLVPTPPYIATEIKLTKDDLIIVLDDDESVHGAWDTRFNALVTKNPTLKIKHFYQGKETVDYINNLTLEQKENTFLLTDYELLGQDMNGLDVVRETNMSRAILVTSYASKTEIQELVAKAAIQTLPKDLASAVPIVIDNRIPKWSNKADMVWVEDQKFFVNNLVSRYYGHITVDVYYEPVSFLQDVHQYPLTTKIILDTYYEIEGGNGKTYPLTGYDLAEKLHEMGYTRLILISGESVDPDNIPAYLRVILKTDTEVLKTLDKI